MQSKATMWYQCTHTRMVKMEKKMSRAVTELSYTGGGYNLVQPQKYVATSTKAEHMHNQ